MTLLVDELFNGITFVQKFRTNRSIQIAAIRPWIYKQGTLTTGELVMQVYQDGVFLNESRIDHTLINEEIPATYAHGMITMEFDQLILHHDCEDEYTEYEYHLFMDNYTTDFAFVGSCRRYELKIYDTYGLGVVDGEAPNDFVEPMGFELHEYID